MATRQDLMDWVYEALTAHGGEASIVDVAKHIWANHETELKTSGNLFYTWQYDMRWAAKRLRDMNKLTSVASRRRGVWSIKGK